MALLRILAVGLLLASARTMAALPSEVAVTAPAKLEVLRDGRVTGSIGLRTGEKLEVIESDGAYLNVRYRSVLGRILAAHTDLRPLEASAAREGGPASAPVAPAVPVATAQSAPPVTTPAPEAATPYVPKGAIEEALAGKLVGLAGSGVERLPASRLAGIKFYAVYFSASWCGPCKQFTPELVDAYGKIRALYPEFEIVLVNRDRSPAAMVAYMRDDRMPWPALSFEAIKGSKLNRYAGSGIPCLVLIDETGKVLSDSYRWGKYVGPDTVLDDTWKILREYRRTHPRPKAS